MGEAQAAAGTLGLEAVVLDIRRAEEIAPAFEALKGRADALYVCASPLVNTHRVGINTWALTARLPMMYGFREAVEAGALMSYGANFSDLFRRAADYVDKILHGVKPRDIPVEQPTKFRPRHQSDDCQGARPYGAPHAARPRQRGDRIDYSLLRCLCRLM
jgi:ABC-type uncharacterized transport system substrate-binding protein